MTQTQLQTRTPLPAVTAHSRPAGQSPHLCHHRLAMAWFSQRLREVFGPEVILDLLPDQSVRVQVRGIGIPFSSLDDLLDTVA